MSFTISCIYLESWEILGRVVAMWSMSKCRPVNSSFSIFVALAEILSFYIKRSIMFDSIETLKTLFWHISTGWMSIYDIQLRRSYWYNPHAKFVTHNFTFYSQLQITIYIENEGDTIQIWGWMWQFITCTPKINFGWFTKNIDFTFKICLGGIS